MQRLLITRRLPDRVLEAARARFDVTLRDRTEVLSPEELRAAREWFRLERSCPVPRPHPRRWLNAARDISPNT